MRHPLFYRYKQQKKNYVFYSLHRILVDRPKKYPSSGNQIFKKTLFFQLFSTNQQQNLAVKVLILYI